MDGGFEADPPGWIFDGSHRVAEDVRSGNGALLLILKKGQAHALAMDQTFLPQARSCYRVVFWARTRTGQAAVRSNFYSDASYDFPQAAISLTPDGDWHRYEAELPVGDFLPVSPPRLRLWILGDPAKVWIDDVSIEPVLR